MTQKELTRLVKMADGIEIQMLMAKFTQYFDQFNAKKIYEKLLAFDHPDISVEFTECGVFEGPEKVRAYFEGIQNYLDDPSDKRGWMAMQNLANPHIVISRDRTRAMGSWDVLSPCSMMAASYPSNERKLTAFWFCGRYCNEFINVNGQWKLLKMICSPYGRH
ncbi:MAG: nuclear transport factor 2 family protein [Clostridiales bacterium]|nr:nuclear transport factor 2 family protein [Clostridiales bacterium]